MANQTSANQTSAKSDPRTAIVEALLRLAAEEPFEDIRIAAICREAGVTLAEFRDAFPSKGAVLGGFSRMIDRQVLTRASDDLSGEGAKDRLFDVLMSRLDAMAPYKAGLKGVAEWARRDPIGAYPLNAVLLNSMRFMMEAADLESDGLHGAMKLQGLVALWSRVLDVWFSDDDPGLARTMAELDRALERGGRVAARLDDLHRLTSPLRDFGAALIAAGRNARRDRRRGAGREDEDETQGADEAAPPAPSRMRGGWPHEEPATRLA